MRRQLLQAFCNEYHSAQAGGGGELRRTLAREKELGQVRTNFLSMVSHEFRAPLGIIQSSAEQFVSIRLS
jgi:signal transduction histidine kinase